MAQREVERLKRIQRALWDVDDSDVMCRSMHDSPNKSNHNDDAHALVNGLVNSNMYESVAHCVSDDHHSDVTTCEIIGNELGKSNSASDVSCASNFVADTNLVLADLSSETSLCNNVTHSDNDAIDVVNTPINDSESCVSSTRNETRMLYESGAFSETGTVDEMRALNQMPSRISCNEESAAGVALGDISTKVPTSEPMNNINSTTAGCETVALHQQRDTSKCTTDICPTKDASKFATVPDDACNLPTGKSIVAGLNEQCKAKPIRILTRKKSPNAADDHELVQTSKRCGLNSSQSDSAHRSETKNKSEFSFGGQTRLRGKVKTDEPSSFKPLKWTGKTSTRI